MKDCEISDHCLVTAILECVHHLPTGKSTSTKYVRCDFRQFNPDTFQMLLQNADLSQFSSHDDVNSMWSGWCGKFLEALDKVAPLKSCRPGPKKKCPFMSAVLLHPIHSRKAAYRKSVPPISEMMISFSNSVAYGPRQTFFIAICATVTSRQHVCLIVITQGSFGLSSIVSQAERS